MAFRVGWMDEKPRREAAGPRRCVMKVKDMMHSGVEFVSPDATLAQVARKMRDSDIGAIPVCENGKPVGIVTDRDIAVRAVANGQDLSKLAAKDVMSRKVVCCEESEGADDALRVMEKHKVRRLPVLDASQKLIGMVSLGDISHAMPQQLTAEVTKAVSAHHA
jgi:CBS domain-containing protein